MGKSARRELFMIKIAVIDDEIEERERLLGYYQRLKAEVRDELEIRTFVSGDEFLGESEESYDLICLDIDMEGRGRYRDSEGNTGKRRAGAHYICNEYGADGNTWI